MGFLKATVLESKVVAIILLRCLCKMPQLTSFPCTCPTSFQFVSVLIRVLVFL